MDKEQTCLCMYTGLPISCTRCVGVIHTLSMHPSLATLNVGRTIDTIADYMKQHDKSDSWWFNQPARLCDIAEAGRLAFTRLLFLKGGIDETFRAGCHDMYVDLEFIRYSDRIQYLDIVKLRAEIASLLKLYALSLRNTLSVWPKIREFVDEMSATYYLELLASRLDLKDYRDAAAFAAANVSNTQADLSEASDAMFMVLGTVTFPNPVFGKLSKADLHMELCRAYAASYVVNKRKKSVRMNTNSMLAALDYLQDSKTLNCEMLEYLVTLAALTTESVMKTKAEEVLTAVASAFKVASADTVGAKQAKTAKDVIIANDLSALELTTFTF